MITKLLNFNSFDKGEGNYYSETLVFRFFFSNSFFCTDEYRVTFCLACYSRMRVRGKFLLARRIDRRK